MDEPWILAETLNGRTVELSLLDTFKRAQEIKQLAGELPTQDFAVLRLLLAIMYGTFISSDIQDADDALALWKELWNLKKFPYDMIEDYLKSYEDRFWLFHPKTPFYQNPDIQQAIQSFNAGKKSVTKEAVKPVYRLIGDLSQSDNSFRLFPGRTGIGQEQLPYDEAARWLLHLNGFDDNSAKNPTPKSIGYLGTLGPIYAKGNNFFETLMLNFVLVDTRGKVVGDNHPDAYAYWEKPPCNKIENLMAQPAALKDLYTLQSRRILLKSDKPGYVTGYLLSMGDYFAPSMGLYHEPMTVWAKDDKLGFKPKRHIPSRQIWRDFSSLLNTAADNNTREPGIINWLKFLQENSGNKALAERIINISTVGIYYKLTGTTWMISDVFHDSLAINGMLLSNVGKNWIPEIVLALEKTDNAIKALGQLAASTIYSRKGSGDEQSVKNQKSSIVTLVKERVYNDLDQEFRVWLQSIDPLHDFCANKISDWLKLVKKNIIGKGMTIIQNCDENTLIGRIKETSNKDNKISRTNYNMFTAYNLFEIQINKYLE